MEIRDRRGRLVQTRRMDACFGNGAERARPDAERFGCPVVLVAPDPQRAERGSLATLLDEALDALAATDPGR